MHMTFTQITPQIHKNTIQGQKIIIIIEPMRTSHTDNALYDIRCKQMCFDKDIELDYLFSLSVLLFVLPLPH